MEQYASFRKQLFAPKQRSKPEEHTAPGISEDTQLVYRFFDRGLIGIVPACQICKVNETNFRKYYKSKLELDKSDRIVMLALVNDVKVQLSVLIEGLEKFPYPVEFYDLLIDFFHRKEIVWHNVFEQTIRKEFVAWKGYRRRGEMMPSAMRECLVKLAQEFQAQEKPQAGGK